MEIITIYIFGFIVLLSIEVSQINMSVIRSNMTFRMIKSFFYSVFWFVTVPYSCVRGDFFKSQEELDEKLFIKYRDRSIDQEINNIKKKQRITSHEEKLIRMKLISESGTLQSLLDDIVYFSINVTKEELAGLIAYHYCQNIDCKNTYSNGPEEFVINEIENLTIVTEDIQNDIGWEVDKTNCKKNNSFFEKLLGFHTLEHNGLTFLGAISDTEHPFFFIIYYDGMKLRAFVPKYNLYNLKENQPFGDRDKDYNFLTSISDKITRKNMYSDYKKLLDPRKTLIEISQEVNYIPRKGKVPNCGWKDIKFGEKK